MSLTFHNLLLGLLVAFFSATAWAHKASDAYLLLTQATAQAPVQAQLAIALIDLDRAFDKLDANNDRSLNFTEIKAALPDIERWIGQGVELRCGARSLPLAWRYEALDQRSDGVFVRLGSSTNCDTSKSMSLRYALMQEVDADHRAIVSFYWQKESNQAQGSAAIKPSQEWKVLADHAKPSDTVSRSTLSTLGSFILFGMEHIGSGADHIAFIICLVLTLALTLAREWKTLLITITAFTLGHSITLITATLGWVGTPSWVEPMIALSIAVSAAFNLIKQRLTGLQSPLILAAIAAIFGLVHGLGFSGAMTQAQLPEGSLLWALAGFNIGVEIGQLLIVAVWALIYWAIHRWVGFQCWIVQGGSMALIVLALYWFIERLG
jgi:HupE / UreJ protein